MTGYVARRLLGAALVLVLVATVVFALFEALPGDAATAILSRGGTGARPSPEQLAALRHELGLDRPAGLRYLEWFGGVLHGDFGTSALTGRPIADVLAGRTWNSVVLAMVTVVVLVPLALLLGLWAGARPGGRSDRTISLSALAADAVPTFVAGVVLIAVVALGWRLLPAVSLVPRGTDPLSRPAILVLPVLCLLISLLPHPIRVIRARTAEVMGADYIRSARLNGVGESRLLLRHAAPNAIASALHPLAGSVVGLVGGVAVVEMVFGYPGLAQEMLRAIAGRDFLFVQSAAVVMAAFGLAVYLAADILALLLDPPARRAVLPGAAR